MPQDLNVTAAIAFIIFVMTTKGGAGKSLISTNLAQLLTWLNRDVRIISIDDNHPTARFLKGYDITTGSLPPPELDEPDLTDLESLGRGKDPFALPRAFLPIEDALEKSAQDRRDIVVDLGSPAAGHALHYCWMTDFAKRALADNIRPVIVTPYGAQEESIVQALGVATASKRIFGPEALIVPVENLRDGRPTGQRAAKQLEALRRIGNHAILPRLPDLWEQLEVADLGVDTALSMKSKEVAERIGEVVHVTRYGLKDLYNWREATYPELGKAVGIRRKPKAKAGTA